MLRYACHRTVLRQNIVILYYFLRDKYLEKNVNLTAKMLAEVLSRVQFVMYLIIRLQVNVSDNCVMVPSNAMRNNPRR